MRSNDLIHFCPPGRLILGCGTRHQLPALVQRMGWRTGLLVTDRFFAEHTPGVRDYVSAASALGIHTEVYDGGMADPSTTLCDEATQAMRLRFAGRLPDHVVALGGGYLPNLKGKTSINLKYGNLQARDITNDLLMDIAYGKATVGEVNNLSGNLSYSDYRGTYAGVVILTTKYPKVHLDNTKTVTTSSKYDSYRFGTVNTLTLTGAYDDIQIGALGTGTLDTKYSGIDISSLSSALTSDISYGSLTVDNLKTTFKNITVNTSYAPVKIYGSVPAKVEVEGKYFDADLGADFIQKHKVSEGSSKVIKGYKISDKTGAVINITSKYGDVIIR